MGGALGLFGELDQKRLLIIGLGFCPGKNYGKGMGSWGSSVLTPCDLGLGKGYCFPQGCPATENLPWNSPPCPKSAACPFFPSPS